MIRAAGAIALLAVLAGCGDEAPTARPATTPAVREHPPKRPKLHVRHARCAPRPGNCRAATGRIVYVEAVDPDGDGDLHLVLAGGNITLPGVSVLDVSRDLRPQRTPRVGDLASGAGPVYQGSYGQRQIQVTEVHVAYR